MTADTPTGTDVNAAPDIKPALDVIPKETQGVLWQQILQGLCL